LTINIVFFNSCLIYRLFLHLGWISSVKSQAGCGSCTAFATAAAAEAALIKAGADQMSTDLSEQWLLNCSPYGGGCNGAWPDAYSKWIPTRGVLMQEKDYPYTQPPISNKEDCQDGPYWNPGYKIDNFVHGYDCTDKEIMMQIKEYGSVVMTLRVEGGFGNYKSGVFGCFR
jgi:C1A family cysteine protease